MNEGKTIECIPKLEQHKQKKFYAYLEDQLLFIDKFQDRDVLKTFGITDLKSAQNMKPVVVYNHDAKMLEIDVRVFTEMTDLSKFEKVQKTR